MIGSPFEKSRGRLFQGNWSLLKSCGSLCSQSSLIGSSVAPTSLNHFIELAPCLTYGISGARPPRYPVSADLTSPYGTRRADAATRAERVSRCVRAGRAGAGLGARATSSGTCGQTGGRGRAGRRPRARDAHAVQPHPPRGVRARGHRRGARAQGPRRARSVAGLDRTVRAQVRDGRRAGHLDCARLRPAPPGEVAAAALDLRRVHGVLQYCLYGSPQAMKPWYDEKAAYIAPDVALSECVPALITDATLTTVLGACEQFGAEDARRLMENQFRAADYTGAADLSDGGYSRDAMLEMLRLR